MGVIAHTVISTSVQVMDSLLAQHFSQKDKILVVFGYLANDHGHF